MRTRTRKARALAVTGLTWSAFSWASSARLDLGVGQLLPLVEQAGVDLAHHLAEPGDQVLEVLGLQVVRDGVLQRLVGAREVAQHDALGAGQLVEGDELREGHRPFVHVADDGLRRQRMVADPRVALAVDVVGVEEQLLQRLGVR